MDKLFTKFLVIYSLLLLLGCQPKQEGLKVVAVKDGDTIELLESGKAIRVRLYGVDAPEKNQDFGTRSRQFTSDLAFNQNVQLIKHNTDRYGRTVGTIILPDGKSLNEELLRNGMAWHYKAYSKEQNLANLEADARRYKRGLWSLPNPVAPWDFRKGRRNPAGNQTTFPIVEKNKRKISKNESYYCNSEGSAVYHLDRSCHILKRCKAEIITTTAKAAEKLGRKACKVCSK